jgi:hypothetical protein
MWYGLAADLVVAVHFAYIAFVVVGQLAITVAAPFKWQWARNPWFRFTHLAAIGYVVYEALYSIRCPLTIWEERLRALAGQAFDASDTFLGRLLHSTIFVENQPEIWHTTVYIAMFALVVQGLVMYPPRWFRFKRKATVEMAPAA